MATESARVRAVPRDRLFTRVAAAARRVPAAAWLGLLVAAVAGLNVWWRVLETRPPHWDMGHHLANSLLYLNSFSVVHPRAFLQGYAFYPPLVYWVTDAFYAVLGNEAMWVAILSNVVWLAVLAFSTFAIGRRLWNSRVGWLSVVFVLASPMIVSSSKEYMLDLPLTAVSALALLLLIRADGFSSRRDSLLFGLVCGCGLLVKWTFPLVVALPVVHAMATALADVRVGRQFRRLANLALAGAACLAVAGVWYSHNLANVLGSSLYYSGHGVGADSYPHVATPASALWYLWNLLDHELYLVPLLLVAAGVVWCFRRHELARRNAYPILMAVGTYVLFSLLRHKDPRYTLPMLPALAIVATSWLEYVSARARAWIATAFVTYAAVTFLAVSFGTSLLPRTVALDLPATSFAPGTLTLFGQYGYIIGPPTRENWHQEDAFRAIARFPRPARSFAYRGPDTVWFNSHGLDYFRLRYDARWANARTARFLIERGSPRPAPAGFTRLDRWRLPDGGTLAVYRRLS